VNKKIVIAIIIILLLIGILFLANKFLTKQKQQAVYFKPEKETAQVEVSPAPIEKPVVKKPPQEAPGKQTTLKEPLRKKVFMGNRGYLIKDKKSTFIKPSILVELKKNNYYKEVIENQ